MGIYDRIFADVRKDLPSVVDAVLRQEVFRVLDDFTQVTNIWQEHVVVNIAANVVSYSFQTYSGKPNRLMTVYQDVPMPGPLISPPLPITEFPPNPTFWPHGPATMRVPGVLRLDRVPTGAGSCRVVVAKRVAEPLDADKYPVLDEWIVDKYADTIGRGILARLMIQPQKPYSNPMLAKVNQAAYLDGRGVAGANDGNENVYGAQTWRFPQGWATVSRKGSV